MDKYQKIVLRHFIALYNSDVKAFTIKDAKHCLSGKAKDKAGILLSSLVDEHYLRQDYTAANNTTWYRLTYKGLHHKRIHAAEWTKRLLDSIFIPIAVAVVTTLILQLIEYLPRLLEQMLLNGGPYPGN